MTRFAAAGLIPLPAPFNAEAGSSWFRVAADSRCFEGHFDGAPILPGVAHLALAVSACPRADGQILAGIRDVRFSHPLGPGDEVEVVLVDGKDADSVRFEIRRDGQPVSGGLLLFRVENDVSRS